MWLNSHSCNFKLHWQVCVHEINKSTWHQAITARLSKVSQPYDIIPKPIYTKTLSKNKSKKISIFKNKIRTPINKNPTYSLFNEEIIRNKPGQSRQLGFLRSKHVLFIILQILLVPSLLHSIAPWTFHIWKLIQSKQCFLLKFPNLETQDC